MKEHSNYPKNSFFCDITKTFTNRAFICKKLTNCTISDNPSLKTYCLEEKLSKFKCNNESKTIEFFRVCNHINDCEDKSDEKYCGIIKNY